MTNIVANGNAYSDDGSSSRDMQGGGFRQWLLPMLGDVMQQAGDGSSAATDAADAAALSASTASSAAIAAQDALDAIALIGNGWTPVPRIAVDGARYVLEIYNWTGGLGPKPATGFLAASGLVPNVANGLNFRGAMAYADLTGNPTLGTAAALNVPATAETAATATQVVRGDDPRLVGALDRGTQTYTTSQAIPKSTFGTATYVLVELWGGGASGGAIVTAVSGSTGRAGGEGGEYVQALLRVASLAASESLIAGSGGAAVVSTSNALVGGNPGGYTSFAGVVALGGLAGSTQDGPSKNYLAGKNGGDGGGASPSSKSTTLRLAGGPGGSSVNGGGGGGGSDAVYNAPGTSAGGGNGGAGLTSATSPAVAGSGTAPSGGGGGVRLNLASGTATSGAGARGQARLTWW